MFSSTILPSVDFLFLLQRSIMLTSVRAEEEEQERREGKPGHITHPVRSIIGFADARARARVQQFQPNLLHAPCEISPDLILSLSLSLSLSRLDLGE